MAFFSFPRLQDSRILCERGRPSICERKAVWSECENGEGGWGERPLGVRGSRALQARIALTELRAFRKRPKTTVLQSVVSRMGDREEYFETPLPLPLPPSPYGRTLARTLTS